MDKQRFHWLADLVIKNNFKTGAEIGCKEGITTSYLLAHCPDLILTAIDLWELNPSVLSQRAFDYHSKWDYGKIREQFKNRTDPYKDRLILLKGVSWEMADKVDDDSLDFVFIDADHVYNKIMKDLKAWGPKVKTNGILCGHDLQLPDVQKALKESFKRFTDTKIDNVWYCTKEDIK